MGIKQVSPYVNFNGNASEAIAVYQRVLGAVVVNVTRFGEVPGMPVDEGAKGRVIHGVLKIGPSVMMLSDSMPGKPVAAEGNAHVQFGFRHRRRDDPGLRAARCGRTGDCPAPGHVLGGEVRDADRRVRRPLDLQCKRPEVAPGASGARVPQKSTDGGHLVAALKALGNESR